MDDSLRPEVLNLEGSSYANFFLQFYVVNYTVFYHNVGLPCIYLFPHDKRPPRSVTVYSPEGSV